MTLNSLTLPSFAKINWSVRVLGRRPDGYHEVRTILQTVSIHDDLEFEVTGDGNIRLTCDQPGIPTDDQNLIVRAAILLRNSHHVGEGVSIRLVKRIPARGGLGGGSSNAAVALLALAHLWNITPSGPELLSIAAQLGADVPCFLMGGAVLGTGTGSTVTPLPDEKANVQPLIVVAPNTSVSTANAYEAMNLPALTTLKQGPILSNSHDESNSGDSQQWLPQELSSDVLKNDFEAVIFDIEPEIRRAMDALLQAGAVGALLAGSGSSVFGIFSDADAQQRGIAEIHAEDGWRIFPCVTLSRGEYRNRVGSKLFHSFT